MDSNVYKAQLFFDGTDDDADTLRKHLAQSVSDEFNLRHVFGVTVSIDEHDAAQGRG